MPLLASRAVQSRAGLPLETVCSMSGRGMLLVRTVAARLQAPAARLGPASSGGAFPCVRRRALAIWHPAQLRVEGRAFSAQGRGVPVAPASGTFAGILDLPIQRRWMSTSGISAEDFPVVELMKQVEVIKVLYPCTCVSLHESSLTPPQGMTIQ